MAYLANSSLPKALRAELPEDAQDVYRVAYNNALAASKAAPEAKVAAWKAVEMGYEQVDGAWVRRKELALS